ncbi:hypothetical protein PHLCEN_2v315 [Hermanssonia centrifuga]|uniref:SRP54-type proteins GTP-binding domain-containing protein n=1 Tax=Hermanssonia centrifuga TaxID=98765 RepID=A0A2R6S6D4_9APHY|nr:hypothetical protein PHLCEN_2v315 [Hermanssonia centrifuga]
MAQHGPLNSGLRNENVRTYILSILQHAVQLHRLSIDTINEERAGPLDPRLIEAFSSLTSIKDLSILSCNTKDTAKLLKSLQSTSLTKVHICFKREHRLNHDGPWTDEEDPSIFQALATLTGLKDLTIGTYASSFIPVLRSLQSPVVKMHLTFERVPNQVAPMSIIQNFNSSLEQLSLVWYSEHLAPHHGAQFLRMTELDITCRGPFLTIDTLIYSFPNLRVLHAGPCGLWPLAWERAAGEAQRQTNLASQSRRHWESLDHLEGRLEYLYPLGISCKVEHLRLILPELPNVLPDMHNDFMGNDLAAILSTTRPKRLSVSIRCRWFEIQSYDMALYRAREYLTHLSVVVEIDGDAPTDSDAQEEIIGHVLFLLSSLSRLSHLTLNLIWRAADPLDFLGIGEPFQNFRKMNPEELAAEISGVAPAINHIVLTISGQIKYVYMYEVVKNDEGERTLVELLGEAAWKVQRDGFTHWCWKVQRDSFTHLW